MSGRWTLRRRIATLLVGVGVALVALLGSSVVVLLDIRGSQDRIMRDYFEAITVSNERVLAFVEAEAAVREYVFTGDPGVLGPVDSLGGGEGASAVERIRGLLAEDPQVLASFDAAVEDSRAWGQEWLVPALAAVEEGGRGAVGPDEVARGRALYEQTRESYAAYLDAARERRQEAYDDVKRSTSVLFGVSLASVALTLAIAVAMLLLLLRWVVRPLDELAAETRAVREGDLGHAVTVQGPPEVEALADDVEAMRRGLVGQIEEVRRTSAEIESASALVRAQADDLQRSNRDLEQFAYVASHDLQEPLRKVASFCQLLQKRYGGQLDDRADQYIGFAVDGAKRMQALINDLLSFSRVGRVSAGAQEVDLEACLSSALRNLESAVEETGGEVTHDELPQVFGEAPLLTQLLQNLVGNALKFRRPGVPPQVHVSARRVEDCWEFACADNGIGIEQQYAERVFVIFQRLHPKDEYEGTGIGLALCRKIVEFHGGRIWIDPDVEVGTTIRWTLPLEPVTHVTAADISHLSSDPDSPSSSHTNSGASA